MALAARGPQVAGAALERGDSRSRRTSSGTHRSGLLGTDPRGLLLDHDRDVATAPAGARAAELEFIRLQQAAHGKPPRSGAGVSRGGGSPGGGGRSTPLLGMGGGDDEVSDEWLEELGLLLYRAAERGDAVEVRRLVTEDGAPVNYRRGGLLGHDTTPLIAAARAGRVVACAALVELGASAAYKDAKWWSALHHACTAESELEAPSEPRPSSADASAVALDPTEQPPDVRGVVEVLLAGGAAVHVPDHTGCTPLHLAARRGLTATVRTILSGPARASGVHKSLAQPDSRGDLPTHLAARHGHAEIVRILLAEAKEAEVEVARVEADAARAEALDAQLEEEMVARQKIRDMRREHKAAKAEQSKRKKERIAAALQRERLLKDMEDDLKSVGGSSVGERSASRASSVTSGTSNRSGRTSGSGGARDAQGRLMSKAELEVLEARDRDARRRRRAKKRAMRQASAVTVRAHVNWKNQAGQTPLHAAARSGKSDVVAALLEYGSDPLLMSKKRETALRVAKTYVNHQDPDEVRTVELLELAHAAAVEEAEKRRTAPKAVERESPLRRAVVPAGMDAADGGDDDAGEVGGGDLDADSKGVEDVPASPRLADSPARAMLRRRVVDDDARSLMSAGRPGTPLRGAIVEHGSDDDDEGDAKGTRRRGEVDAAAGASQPAAAHASGGDGGAAEAAVADADGGMASQ
mmetsp:Transcript_519/g.1459  ORF Transcript_519/g.1459 Transcript_519/m.1459 type:complete len:696 (-) Transcript_519:49-2136(-)